MSSQLTNAVVLVEDQEVIATTVTYIIESCGAPVEAAGTLAAALELIRRVRPKVILMDVELPDGLGVDLCAVIRSEPAIAEAAIYLVSTHDPDTLRAMAQEAGANGYLCKPFDPDRLLELVSSALASSESFEAAPAQ
jgi:DNA-binding response OmpR family regulator